MAKIEAYKKRMGWTFPWVSSFGADLLLGAYNWLDLTPKGRNEKGPMDWVRRHDLYEN